MSILLGLIGFYIYQSEQLSLFFPPEVKLEKPLDGKNEIQHITIKNDDAKNPFFLGLNVKYRYIGNVSSAGLRAYALSTKEEPVPNDVGSGFTVQRGENTSVLMLRRRSENPTAYSTRLIRVEMINRSNSEVIASKDLEYPIEWSRMENVMERANHSEKDIETLYREAVAELDFNSRKSLSMAKILLENIIRKDSKYVSAYPEFARYYMKSIGGVEGYRLAEKYLSQGLEIDQNHANSHVLLGYVYTNQKRYDLAEKSFKKAVAIGTDNPWLWVNWGQYYSKQGKINDAIDMYQKVIDSERRYDRHIDARTNAYFYIIDAYIKKGDFEQADNFYLKRLDDYPNQKCFSFRYAKFRQRHFDNAETVLKHARIAQDFGCYPKNEITELVGIAYYSKWLKSTDGESRQSNLRQAQTYYPESPKLFLNLASFADTLAILKKLVDDGANIDISDNNGFTALGYAVGTTGNLHAAKFLITLGADTNITIGENKIPILAIALLGKNKESAKLLIKHGADIEAPVNSDTTILNIIDQMGYRDILKDLKKET